MKIETVVRPDGSYSNYLAYGEFDRDGNFKRIGYPKNILKPIYGKSWGGHRGNASYEYEVSFEVPADFKYAIVKVGSGKQSSKHDLEVLYPLQATYYHGTSIAAVENMLRKGIQRGTWVSTDFQWSVYYALKHFPEGVAVLEVSAQAIAPTELAFDEERIVVGAARISEKYTPLFTSIPEDWMEPNDDITSQRYPELFSMASWQASNIVAKKESA
jgi:hypothetical protein